MGRRDGIGGTDWRDDGRGDEGKEIGGECREMGQKGVMGGNKLCTFSKKQIMSMPLYLCPYIAIQSGSMCA